MEKDGYFGGNGSWQPQSNDINSSPLHVGDQLGCFLNLNWDQTANFESALSSLVSSPTSSTPNSVPPSSSGAADSVVIRELIGRLGSICSNSSGAGGEISPPRSHYQSTNTSCYSTPLNSPPKLNLSMIDNQNHHQQLGRVVGAPNHFDPSLAERAVKYSCFGPGMGGPKPGKLSRVSSSQSLKPGALTHSELSKDSPMQQQANEPSASDRMAADASEGNVKKRKATLSSSSKGGRVKTSSAKMIEEENSKAKRSRAASSNGAQKDAEEKDNEKEKEEKENNVKALEPPKDYIHVRARRGQATDSHSLAERVRREKISERMKFLQDLVPGCNKITGKAVMLDEIINYVQSLQRQVEFLSMKLATVNPQLDFNPDNLLTKDTQQPLLSFPLEATSSGFPYANQTQGLATNGLELQCSVNPLLDSNFHRSLSMQLPSLDGLSGAASQLGVFWENDLQSVVQMGFGQNQEAIFSSPNSQGSLPTNQMKIEL